MGLLRRLRRAPGRAPANVNSDWRRNAEWLTWGPPLNVLREGAYQDQIIGLVGKPCKRGYLIPAQVTLVREAHNPHDGNAIRAVINGLTVAYLRREVAAVAGPAMDNAKLDRMTFCGLVRGGCAPHAETIGIHLWLDRRVTDGIEIDFDGVEFEVSWPPNAGEADCKQEGVVPI